MQGKRERKNIYILSLFYYFEDIILKTPKDGIGESVNARDQGSYENL